MIQKFVESWDARKGEVRASLAAAHPENYEAIVRQVVRILDAGGYDDPDQERITLIDHGHYQGTLVFVIGCKGYQPSTYWAVLVNYGSCSGCDTLESIRSYDDSVPSESQVDEYMTLALHILQGLRNISEAA